MILPENSQGTTLLLAQLVQVGQLRGGDPNASLSASWVLGKDALTLMHGAAANDFQLCFCQLNLMVAELLALAM